VFNPLRYFLEVARTGSIRAASERLNVAASAISRHIQIFEEAAGAPLFERHARGMGLTAAGEIYMRYAQGVLAEGDNTQLAIDALKGMKRGHIRIVSIEGLIPGALSDALASFRRRFPEITYSVRAMSTQTVMQAVRDGEADIGIAFQTSPVAGVNISKRIADPLRLICHRHHALAKRKSITLSEVVKLPIAMPDRTFGIRQIVDAACHVHQLRTNIALETNSIEALRSFARNDVGVTILPSLVARQDILARKVSAIRISDSMLWLSSVDICVREGRKLPVVVDEFLKVMQVDFESHNLALRN
jgi:DNA-binding transcriptional LysR family regulator